MSEKLMTPYFSLFLPYLTGVIVLILGWPISAAIARMIISPVKERLDPHSLVLVKKVVLYSLRLLIIFTALGHMGLNLKVLLGAAGIFSVAIGFASQTSASNLISGFFLLVERPFSVGDYIEVGGLEGIIMSIDLLSTRIRTLDNLFIRIPNETLVKSPIKNYTHFPIRRIDLKFGVAYGTDLDLVERLVTALVQTTTGLLDNPAPLFIIKNMGESSIDLQFSVWTTREQYVLAKNCLIKDMLNVFNTHSIKVPYPHRVVIHGATPQASSLASHTEDDHTA